MTPTEFSQIIEGRRIFQRNADKTATRLIILVHGWTTSALRFQSLCEAMLSDPKFEDHDILAIDYSRNSGRFSNADPKQIAKSIAAEISLNVREFTYDSIIISGWSMGGILVREAILQDHEEKGESSFFPKIERVVLLASTNRGFIASNWWDRLAIPLIGPLPICGLIKHALRESRFILNLRMRWIRAFEAGSDTPPPTTIQVRGSDDKIVSDDDSADIYRFKNSASVTVPARGHFDLVEVEDTDHIHYRALRSAFLDELEVLQQRETASPEHFVFLVHGIRDYGGWTRAIENSLQSLAGKGEVATSILTYQFRYGYFNILNFIFPFVRRRQARKFVDRYANFLAKHPNAKLHFVGHSNGTFLLGEAFKSFDGVEFESAYLAGSVLTKNYPWLTVFDEGRLKRLRNDCASRDIPVGFLCGFLNHLSPEIGLGGFRGFQNIPARNFFENRIKGGHGDALKGEGRPENIANWVLTSEENAVPPTIDEPAKWMDVLSKFALPAGVIAIALLVAIGFLLWNFSIPAFAIYVGILLIVLYCI